MQVDLISHPYNALRVCATAARTCYSADTPQELFETIDAETMARVIRNCIKRGHESVIEHAVYTFAVSGISRSCSLQLVRHRVASYSQQSQRYVKMKDDDWYVTPPGMEKNTYFHISMKMTKATYNELLEQGIKPEDARFVLPEATRTNIDVTMNARELRHFFDLRLDRAAQWEIRELAGKMLALCKEATPELFEDIRDE